MIKSIYGRFYRRTLQEAIKRPAPDGACFVIDDEYEALPPNLVKRWKLFQSAGKVL